jgi:formylglycine-generating enzyme required for sulfatase activity/tRNA A-37 threonylcarbamoyl transferase component Bud32
MGVIYQATDLNFNNTVVIKHSRFTEQFLKQQYPAMSLEELRNLAEYLRKAFEREARLVRGLKHHALPSVIDYFTTGDGHQFFVMDFIPGKDFGELLDERMRQNHGPFPLDQTLEWADQLLDALDYLHTRFESPIIHRDLKPLNLKLTPDGRIVLLDFGLAKGATPEMSVVSASIHGYTLQYAPLEQIRGKGTSVRSDLYSLAVTLHHLLSGEMPPNAVDRVTETTSGEADPLRPLHEINPQIPAVVSEVIRRAAAINPNERYTTAVEMREVLRRANELEPTRLTVKLPDQPAEPAIIEPPLLPTERVEFVDDAQRVEAPTIERLQPPAEAREAGRVQIDLSGAPTKQPEIKQPRGNRRRLAALTGGVLVLAIGVGIAVSSGRLFSRDSSTTVGRSPEPALTVAALTTTPSPNVSPAPALQSFTEDLGSGVKLEMVSLSGGKFEMGSPNGQGVDNEFPQHSVTVSPFTIGKYEVTQAQWQAVMGNNPSHFKGKTLPVEQVSWDDAVKFCQKLREKTGKNYRLPTEAEWEYAASAGNASRWGLGSDQSMVEKYGWGGFNSHEKIHPVGQKKPNAFGLYDTLGNVWEWVHDWYSSDYYKQKVFDNPQGPSSGKERGLRGGSWTGNGPCWGLCHPAIRFSYSPGGHNYEIGFRVVADARTR